MCGLFLFSGTFIAFTEPLLLLVGACDRETAEHAGNYTRCLGASVPRCLVGARCRPGTPVDGCTKLWVKSGVSPHRNRPLPKTILGCPRQETAQETHQLKVLSFSLLFGALQTLETCRRFFKRRPKSCGENGDPADPSHRQADGGWTAGYLPV